MFVFATMLSLALSVLPVSRPDTGIDFSRSVHNPALLMRRPEARFLQQRIDQFNREHGVLLTVAVVSSLSGEEGPAALSRAVFLADDVPNPEVDRRALLLVYISSPASGPKRVAVHLGIGGGLQGFFPPSSRHHVAQDIGRALLNRNTAVPTGHTKVFTVIRNALPKVFSRIAPEYTSDVAMPNPELQLTWSERMLYATSSWSRVLMFMTLCLLVGRLVAQVGQSYWRRLGDGRASPLGSLTTKQLFERKYL